MRILMHTIGYPPGQIGGTEVHVEELAAGLAALGNEVHVAVPGNQVKAQSIELDGGVNLHRGWTDEFALSELICEVRPDVVHFHPLYLDNSIGPIKSCFKEYPVVVSYHTPTLTCLRGDLLRMGTGVCDGVVDYHKCVSCVLNQKGLSETVANLCGRIPSSIYSLIAPFLKGRAGNMMGWPARVSALESHMLELWQNCSRLIVVCEWLQHLVVANGMPADRISLARYGRKKSSARPGSCRGGSLCFGYAGRLTEQKGIRVILDALPMIKGAFSVEFCAPEFGTDSPIAAEILAKADKDDRIKIIGSLPPDKIVETMTGWDAVIVPSLWMETGPMVVTEAFHAGIPVIGSDRGGLKELVDDGKTGLLFEPGSSTALAEIISKCLRSPSWLRGLAVNISGGRETTEMVRDVEQVYNMVMR